MAKHLQDSFINDIEFFDLQENPLPMCDGDDCYDLPEVLEFREKVKKVGVAANLIGCHVYDRLSVQYRTAVEESEAFVSGSIAQPSR